MMLGHGEPVPDGVDAMGRLGVRIFLEVPEQRQLDLVDVELPRREADQAVGQVMLDEPEPAEGEG